MYDKKIKFGVITSSGTIISHVREIAENRDEDILISLKGLEEAIPIGKRMEKDGAEVIVSRGGTSHILRQNLNIPVLSIPVTNLNILSSIQRSAQLGKRILLSTFNARISGMEIFEELFDVEISQGIYNDHDSLEAVISSAENQGYEIVIGGGISMKLAREYGLKGVELQTSKETVASIIEDARSVAESKRKVQEQTERYRCIINSISEGIVSVDQNGLITTINKIAKDFFRVSNRDINGNHITNYIPKAKIMEVMQTQKPVINKVEKINNHSFVASHIPILVGTETAGGVSIFKDIFKVMKDENEVRRSFAKGLIAKYSLKDIVYHSLSMNDVINKIKMYAPTRATILITGETGTGKELAAHSIHNLSRMKNGPFVSINCAALPDQLLESELFGYEEGAFTGSKKGGKPGLFEIAHKGTIFLDEIVATSQNVQTRLLRVLQEREVMRIGGDRLIPIDVQVIATANKDLGKEVQSGNFREDLFFRLNVLQIHIPALREKIEDIPLLADKFIQIASYNYGLKPFIIPKYYINKMIEYSWPGNVRQLRNFIERLVLLSGSCFNPKVFNEIYLELTAYSPNIKKPERKGTTTSVKEQFHLNKKENDLSIIRNALEEAHFSKSKAAKLLGISRTTLWRKLKEAGEY